MMASLLSVEDLRVEFHTAAGIVQAVNGVDFAVDRGETLAILGESGSGKSVTASVIMDILDSPPGFVRSGKVFFDGENLLTLPRKQRRQICGARIAMVFQDALVALNPVYSAGWQIAEALRAHQSLTRSVAHDQAVHLLQRVGIAEAHTRAYDYPHQFSGGQRQRVMIAMALAMQPDILIADEPTTALDVTVQAQIMDLLAELKDETGMGLILITHDLGVVADVADRVAVMYAGRIVEQAPVNAIFANPAHPYTLGLMHSVPRPSNKQQQKNQPLKAISGSPPDLARIPSGCAFHPRCQFTVSQCRQELPVLQSIQTHHYAACHKHDL